MTGLAPDREALVRPFAAEWPFRPHLLDLGGVAMHYADEGPRERSAVLFVHGNPSWGFLWRHAIRALARTRRCIAPDHVGMGLSDKPQDYPYRLAQHVENLGRLVDALELERVDLVVHDWGGPIGLGALLERPALLARAAILNTACFTGFSAPWRIRACRTPLFGALAVRGLNAFARGAASMAVEKPLEPAARRGFLAPYGDWKSRVATLRFVEDIPLSERHPSWAALAAVEARLTALERLPTLLLWGERDFCFDPRFREEWQRRLPGASVVRLERAGHYLLEDARAEGLAALTGFLERSA